MTNSSKDPYENYNAVRSYQKPLEDNKKSRSKTPQLMERDMKMKEKRVSSVDRYNYSNDLNRDKYINDVHYKYRGISPANNSRSTHFNLK